MQQNKYFNFRTNNRTDLQIGFANYAISNYYCAVLCIILYHFISFDVCKLYVQDDTSSHCISGILDVIIVHTFDQTPPPFLQSTESIFSNHSCSALLVVVMLLYIRSFINHAWQQRAGRASKDD